VFLDRVSWIRGAGHPGCAGLRFKSNLPLRLSSFTSFAPAFRENDVFIAVFRKAARKSGIEKTLAK